MTHTYDIVVIGGGPGGYTAAIRAAQWGKSVAVVEKASLGGTCLHKGCIPSKALLRSAEVYSTLKNSAEYGVQVDSSQSISIDFKKVQHRKAGVVNQLHSGLQALMKKHKIAVFQGKGRLIGPSIFSPRSGSVAIEMPDGETITLMNEHVIVATGSRPRSFRDLDPDGQFIFTSDEALELSTLPQSLLIVGGGVIGVEWASMMNDFGVAVTLIEEADRLLPSEDVDISKEMSELLKKRGIRIITGARMLPDTVIKRVVNDETQEITFEIIQHGNPEEVSAEMLLVAIGRAPNVEGIGLENTDVVVERDGIRVNSWMQTSESHIYAIGDVVAGMRLAHVAMQQGVIAVDHICGKAIRPYQSIDMPRCVYSHPETASIGMTEREAIEAGLQIKTAKFPFRANGKALVYGDECGFVKMVVNQQTNDVIGVHMIGAKVTELIAEASLARLLEATPWEISATVHPHPTLSEVMAEVSQIVDGRAVGL